jgi:hypothetical protein
MCMQNRKMGIYFIVLGMVFVFGSCLGTKSHAVEITDLNGTWQPDRSYRATLKFPKEKKRGNMSLREYSWGMGMTIPNSMFCIDMGDANPFFYAPGDGDFYITDITQTGKDTIKINAYQGDLDDPEYRWYMDFVFHFIDKNTMRVESKFFENDLDYGEPLHRISGPGGWYRWR